MTIGTIVDLGGVYGTALHYSLIFAFMGSAMLIFAYLWRKGRLDMDEEPKMQMMLDEELVKLSEDQDHDRTTSK